MALDTINNDLRVNGTITAENNLPSTGAVTDSTVAANAAIQSTKKVQRYRGVTDFDVDQNVAPSADVNKIVYTARGAAVITSFEVKLHDTGSSTDVKFDLQKATAGSTSYATVLSATVDLTNATADNTMVAGSLSSTALVAGDSLLIAMDHTSATGALGPFARVEVDENPV